MGVDLNRKITIISLLIIVLSLVLCMQSFAQTCVVIASAQRASEPLTATDVERIFLGKMKKWPDGTTITLVYNDEKSIKSTFSQNYLHRSWRQISIYWRKKLYSGRSMLPKFVVGDEQVKEYLFNHPSAISYLSAENVDARIQVLEVKP